MRHVFAVSFYCFNFFLLILFRSCFFFFFSSRRRHTRYWRDWSSDVSLPISADEPQDLAVVNDREDDPVAEPVDQSAGACDNGYAGDRYLLVGDPVPPKIINQAGPAGGCLARLESGIIGDVSAEAVCQVLLPPR